MMTYSEAYLNSRNFVLSLATMEGNTLIPKDGIFAVLMETSHDGATATLVSVSDGSASMYFSNGGSVIGAGNYAEGAEASIKFLQEFPPLLPNMQLVDKFPFPKQDQIIFYVVTSTGVYSIIAPESELLNGKGLLYQAFYSGHELIAVVRTIADATNE